MNLHQLTSYLNDYLAVASTPDYRDAYNGLQVEGTRDVRRVAVAVDACVATIQRGVEADADLIIVHHGLFWGAKAPITGAYYRRLHPLIENGVALYSSHLPLDVHPEIGNNAVLARTLGLTPTDTWGEFEGMPIGVSATTETPLQEFTDAVAIATGSAPRLIATGPNTVRQVGILTGGGGSQIAKAHSAGLDTVLTGEGNHHSYFEAEERGLNVLYAGHYATETFGVCALAAHLEQQFGLETLFLDHPTGL